MSGEADFHAEWQLTKLEEDHHGLSPEEWLEANEWFAAMSDARELEERNDE